MRSWPLFAKIILHERSALLVEDTRNNLGGVVQSFIFGNIIERSAGAGLDVIRAKNKTRNSRKHDRPGAHGAWFNSYIKRAFGKVARFERSTRRGNGHHFGVGGRILQLLGKIMAFRDYPIIPNDDATNRD